jgi:hypothetical protein
VFHRAPTTGIHLLLEVSMIRPSLLAAGLLGTLALASPAHAGFTLGGTPKVSFMASGGMLVPDIPGETSALTVTDDGTTLTFTVPMSTVKTGIDLRDEHMLQRYVEVAKYPDATLRVPIASLVLPGKDGETRKGKADATFTVHGAAAPVKVAYTVRKRGDAYAGEAEFTFDVRKHGIAVPEYQMVSVEPEMRAKVTAELRHAP